jgi:hypothetical protein
LYDDEYDQGEFRVLILHHKNTKAPPPQRGQGFLLPITFNQPPRLLLRIDMIQHPIHRLRSQPVVVAFRLSPAFG